VTPRTGAARTRSVSSLMSEAAADKQQQKVVRDVRITNTLGMHARPASLLAKLAGKFRSDIYIRKGADEVNAKSIMGIITLAASQDAVLRFIASGPDAEEALDAIAALIEGKFGEE
jgi:phosphocarrier protein HPr